MKTLREYIEDAKQRKVAIGLSEGEREFVGAKNAANLVRNLREQYDSRSF